MSEPDYDSYDVVVVGAGPAGISAAINVANRKKSVLVIDGQTPFAKTRKAHHIPNYPGFSFTSGEELAQAFVRHLEQMEVPVAREKVSKIFRDEDRLFICTEKGNYHARAVILAIGVYREGELEGEEELVGQGVSYCVSCDGRLFAGREVAFVSYLPEGEEEARAMADDFGARVTFVPVYAGDYSLPESVRVLPRQRPRRLYRQDGRVHVELPEEELVVDGVFLIKPAVSPRTLMDGLEMEGRHIKVSRMMETGIPGVYAAGDCTADPYQIAKAVGEGQVAAAYAVRYLTEKDRPAREEPRLLSPGDRESIARTLRERIVDPVRIVHFTQDAGGESQWTGPACLQCREARELVEELSGLSSKLQLEVKDFLAEAEQAARLKVPRLPATLVGPPGETPRVRFFGSPAGYEFGVLLEDILQVSAGRETLLEETRRALGGLPGEVHIEVMVTPTCPLCPPAALLAHRFALASEKVSADLVMISEFPEVGQRYQVGAVPAFAINGERVVSDGAVDEERLLELVREAAAAR